MINFTTPCSRQGSRSSAPKSFWPFFVCVSTNRKAGSPLKNFPGGARVAVIAAFVLPGTEVLALGVMGQ
jgi:hypothetical protein